MLFAVKFKSPDPLYGKAKFGGKCGGAMQRRWGECGISCAKTTEPIEQPFGLVSGVGPWNLVLDE